MPNHVQARLAQATPVELDSKGELPKQIMLLPVGTYETGKYGPLVITDDNLAQAVTNYNKGVPNGVPINLDHMYGEAAGWINGLIHQRGVGLFAVVDWTDLGIEKLTSRLYRYFSAEFDFNYQDPANSTQYGFTLTGGALTNYPLMTELPALVANSKKNTNSIILYSRKGASMNLSEIRAKDAAQLSEEEKTFLQEHSADLNDDERTKFGVEAPAANHSGEGDNASKGDDAGEGDGEGQNQNNSDGEGTKSTSTELSQGKSGEVTLSATRLAALEKAANEGQKAMIELNQQRMTRDVVEPMLFSDANTNGRFLPKSKDALQRFVFSLNDSQRTAFSALMAELPKTLSALTTEVGDGGSDVNEDASAKILKLAQAKVAEAAKAGEKIELSTAIDQVSAEHPELEREAYGIGGTK